MPRPQTPSLTADTIIHLNDGDRYSVVLINRLYIPYGWALPGGFVDIGETLESAAIREAKEETGLDVRLEVLLGCYSDPDRDTRGHTVSAVYVAHARGEPKAADDAKDLRVVDLRSHNLLMAFDHQQILEDYLTFLSSGECKSISSRLKS